MAAGDVRSEFGGQIQALARGLEILEILVDAQAPVSGAELARRTGLHPSSISRIAHTLVRLGYVAKERDGLRPDYGILSLAKSASALPGIARTQTILEQRAQRHPGWFVNLCLLRGGQLTYLVRCMAGRSTTTALSFPLHNSSAAMRLLLEQDDDVALSWLRDSHRRHGWSGGPGLPPTEEAALAWARSHVRDDVLQLVEWSGKSVSAAVPVTDPHGNAMAVAMAGSRDDHVRENLTQVLLDMRGEVTAALQRPRR